MITEVNQNRTGWARFSDDKLRRYRLGRVLDPRAELVIENGVVTGYRMVVQCDCPEAGRHRECHCRSKRYGVPFASDDWCNCLCHTGPRRVVFVMLNPSTADAFKLDPTVQNCIKFAQRWGAHVLEVVNLFAHRSPYPEELDLAIDPGMDDVADAQILAACADAYRVIAAWGNHGYRHGRDTAVRKLLVDARIPLMHLGLTQGGSPLHPLARGKHRIPLDREPVALVAL